MLHQRWIAEMVKRGIYVTNHHNHFINYALTDEDIKTTIAVAGEAFSAI
jgi:glutamate-1-semialdehyde 2,1-aminomutase